jgi:hypothetical protein
MERNSLLSNALAALRRRTALYESVMKLLNFFNSFSCLVVYFIFLICFLPSFKKNIFVSLVRRAIEEMTLRRAHTHAHRFQTALTIGGPNGVPKPIELSAHDPIRFIACLRYLCKPPQQSVVAVLD